ncbi:mini-MOMP protein [Campylobacter sp. 2018MI35]|uniref:mini-MOMP protein n=1 Tax=Campylobacter sp. 2018MI34 TaxID=2800582 RepID=UPI001908BA72|nr:mini-MOMP protein [Campylobacter sp. 2018MI34]
MKIIFILISLLSFCFSTPLDEIFKDINVSGVIRYRYEYHKINGFNQKQQKYHNKTNIEFSIK